MEQGDFEQVYREYSLLIYHYLLKLGSPEAVAEDLMQDTFVKALLHIDQFRGDSKLSVWLCQIAKRNWYDYCRKQKRNSPHLQEESRQDDYWFEWLDLVEQLEEPYGELFLKHSLGGWSYGELAKQYGKSESWARVCYHRARMKLQQYLERRNKHETL